MSCGAFEKQVLIRGLKNLNRAVHEDVVAVEILPKDQWVCIAVWYFDLSAKLCVAHSTCCTTSLGDSDH